MLQLAASTVRQGCLGQSLGGSAAAAACSSLYDGLDVITRGVGELSTSYSHSAQIEWVRSFSAPAKGGAKKPAAGAPAAKAAAPDKPKVKSPMQKLRMRTPAANSLSLLGPSERTVARELQVTPKPGAAGAEVLPAELTDIKGIGLPLSSSDIVRVAHDALSVSAGQPVQFRPYVFNSVFQSAPSVAGYVANALQAGTMWPRIERFFLSAVEAEGSIAAMRVQVNGRMGRQASMSSTKAWQKGSVKLQNQSDAIDYGTATAMTRLGVLGVKVWIRYTKAAAAPSSHVPHAPHAGYPLPLRHLLALPRAQLPYKSASAWWNTPGPAQPVTNRTWEALTPDFHPPAAAAAGLGVDDYVAAQQPLLFRSNTERHASLSAMFPDEALSSSSSSSSEGEEERR